MTLARGWKRRRAEADAKREARAADRDDDGMKAIRAERSRLYAEMERASQEQATVEAERRKLARVTCPCCGGSDVGVAEVEIILRALTTLPLTSRPDAWIAENLQGIAAGHDTGALDMPERGTLRLQRPRPVASPETIAKVAASGAADPGQGHDLREPATINPKLEPMKATPRRKLPAAESYAEQDGALLDLDDV